MSDDRIEGFDASWAEVEARVDAYLAEGLARVARWRWVPEAVAVDDEMADLERNLNAARR